MSLSPRLNLETFASTLWDCSTVNAGMGVTKLMRYNFVRHLVYSLLKGRPVIVYGTPQNENLVRVTVPSPPHSLAHSDRMSDST